MSAGVEDSEISFAVWTTTAWTLPSNVAIAASETLDYSLVRRADNGKLLILATERVCSEMEEIFGTTLETLTSFPGAPFFCFPPPRS
jgi:isoleucyl-tRNA synthetase